MKLLLHSALKAQQWEIAKGHLRALAQIDGAVQSDHIRPGEPFPFEKLETFIEMFIKEFEDRGYHEGRD